MPSIEQLTKLLDADPDDTFLLYAIAQEHAKAGETQAALDHYDKVIALDPHEHYAYYHKAKALEDADREDEAVPVLEEGYRIASLDSAHKAASELATYLDMLR